MNSEKTNKVIDDSFSLETLFQYVNENFYGLLLLVLTFVIIYFVDYISRINAMIFAMPSPIPGLPSSVNNIAITKTNKSRKVKKR